MKSDFLSKLFGKSRTNTSNTTLSSQGKIVILYNFYFVRIILGNPQNMKNSSVFSDFQIKGAATIAMPIRYQKAATSVAVASCKLPITHCSYHCWPIKRFFL